MIYIYIIINIYTRVCQWLFWIVWNNVIELSGAKWSYKQQQPCMTSFCTATILLGIRLSAPPQEHWKLRESMVETYGGSGFLWRTVHKCILNYIISFDVKNARKTLTLYPASSSYHYQTTGSRSVKVSQPPYQTYPGSAQTSPNLASKWHWALKMQLPGDSSLSNSCGFRDVAKHNIINIVNGSKAHPITPLRLFHDNNTSKWFYDASN